MYGTKVGLSQDGWSRVLFLLLPNVNQVPTFRPSELVLPCPIIVGISYVDSLLYVLSVTLPNIVQSLLYIKIKGWFKKEILAKLSKLTARFNRRSVLLPAGGESGQLPGRSRKL